MCWQPQECSEIVISLLALQISGPVYNADNNFHNNECPKLVTLLVVSTFYATVQFKLFAYYQHFKVSLRHLLEYYRKHKILLCVLATGVNDVPVFSLLQRASASLLFFFLPSRP